MTEAGLARPVTLPVVPATAAVCPYLLAADGRWRASTPAREHRCTVVTPPAILAAEKQRRLCLTADHVACSTYLAGIGQPADEVAPAAAHQAGRTRRAVTRTVPLVLDHGRVTIAMPRIRLERGFGQNGLVALMGVAFAAIVVARLSAGGPDLTPANAAGAPSASPSAAASARPAATPLPTQGATRTLVPTEVEPTPVPAEASAPPPPPASPRTYKVRSGDTLSGIAGEFGTTWQVLAELNGIDDPGQLRVGQVLQLP